MHTNVYILILIIMHVTHFLFHWCSKECRHIYEKKVIMDYIRSKQQHRGQCPISGIYHCCLIVITFALTVCHHCVCFLTKSFCVRLPEDVAFKYAGRGSVVACGDR